MHADDVADAIARILDRRAPGAFNLAAPPNLDADGLAAALGVRRVPVPAFVLRAGMQAAFRARTAADRAGLAGHRPGRAAAGHHAGPPRAGLGARHRGGDVLREFVAALGRGEGHTGPLLHPGVGAEHTPA